MPRFASPDANKQDTQQGIVRTPRGEDQPKDKDRAQQTAGLKSQQEAAKTQPQSPGEPAGGE